MAVGADFHKAGQWIKAHPYATAGGVFVVGAILIYLYYSGGSKTAAGATDNTAAQLAAQVQSENVQAQYGAALAAQQSQQASVEAQVNGAVSVAQLQAQAAATETTAQAALDAQQIASQQTIDLAGIAANQAINLGSLTAQTNLAQINATSATDQTNALVSFLNNQVSQQFGYLNNQVNTSGSISALGITTAGSLQAAADWENFQLAQGLSTAQFNELQGEVAQGQTNEISQENQIIGLGNTAVGLRQAVDSLGFKQPAFSPVNQP